MEDERTIYDSERTVGNNDENTVFDSEPTQQSGETTRISVPKKKFSAGKGAAMGFAAGLFSGGITTLFARNADLRGDTAEIIEEDDDVITPNDDTAKESELEIAPEPISPAWTDGEVAVATAVSDDMSFAEAFSAARAEVGAGGCYEWHGQIYGTYTEDEWRQMTPQERTDYASHFSWENYQQEDSEPVIEPESVEILGLDDDYSIIEPEDEIIVIEIPEDDHAGNGGEPLADNGGHCQDDPGLWDFFGHEGPDDGLSSH